MALGARLAPGPQPGQVVLADCLARRPDLIPHTVEERIVDLLALRLASFIEVEHLDDIRRGACQLVVAHGIDVQLRSGDVGFLAPLAGLEVNNGELIRRQLPDEVDASVGQ